MPCGAQIEIVQLSVQRGADIEVTDHADLEIRLLPILPQERLHGIVREELVARGWEVGPEGELVRTLDGVTATLPAGSSTVRVTLSGETSVSVTTKVNERITAGDERARAEVQQRAEEAADRRLAAASELARQQLEQEGAPRLLAASQQLRDQLDEVVTSTTRRALEQRASELGSIESISEQDGDRGYELTITVRT